MTSAPPAGCRARGSASRRGPGRLDRSALRTFARSRKPWFEKLLRTLVEVPSISADPDRRADIRRCATLAADALTDAGASVKMLRSAGANPLVVGSFFLSRSLPTITIYNHLDVQPADSASEGWLTDPFLLTRRGSRYHGRGTTDDKGPALTALMGIEAAREAGVPVNFRILWETEEEIGSPHLEQLLRRNMSRLATDWTIISDTVWLSRRIPTITGGLRGVQAFRFTLETGGEDRHSGDVGGAARNPLAELMEIASRIHDARTGKVKVPGFHDGMVRADRRLIGEFRRSGFSLAAFRRTEKLRLMRSDDPVEVMSRIWAEPTFEVHGVAGGYAGPGLKAIVPGRAELKASCRLVPGQDPARIFRLVKSFVRKINPDVKVIDAGSALPVISETTGRGADALREAITFGFGKRPAFVRDGGSIGAVVSLRKILKAPVLFLGISLPEDGYHAPNESFDWRQAEGGTAAFARCFEILSAKAPR